MQRRELLRLGKKMRRCLDEGDVPALHDVVRLGAPDSVIIALPAIAAHFPSPGRGVKRSVSDFHEGLTSNDRRYAKLASSPSSTLNGACILSASCAALFLRHAAAINSSPHMDDGQSLSASMH